MRLTSEGIEVEGDVKVIVVLVSDGTWKGEVEQSLPAPKPQKSKEKDLALTLGRGNEESSRQRNCS